MLRILSLKAESIHEEKNHNSIAVDTSWRQKMDKLFSEMMEPKKSSDHDIIAIEARVEKLDKFYSNRSESSWRDRLEVMWSADQFGVWSPELSLVKEATELCFFAGVCYGAYQETAKVYRIFMDQNKYTMFQHPREAQRALQERLVLAMIQGGWRSGWRLGLLAFTFTSVTQSLVVMRNYINPLDYAIGGVVMGSVYRVHMGPKAMVGAGIAGALLGFQGGILTWCVQKFSGETVAEKWAREYDMMKESQKLKQEVIEKKDQRHDILIEESKKDTADTHTETKDYSEDNWWLRRLVIKVVDLFMSIGIMKADSNDSFRISDSSPNFNAVNNVKNEKNNDPVSK